MKEFYKNYTVYFDSFYSILAVFILGSITNVLITVPGTENTIRTFTWLDSLEALLSYVCFYVSITVLRENYKKYFSSTETI